MEGGGGPRGGKNPRPERNFSRANTAAPPSLSPARPPPLPLPQWAPSAGVRRGARVRVLVRYYFFAAGKAR